MHHRHQKRESTLEGWFSFFTVGSNPRGFEMSKMPSPTKLLKFVQSCLDFFVFADIMTLVFVLEVRYEQICTN